MRREYDFTKAKREAVVPPAPGKTRVTIRVDNAILDWFRDRVEARAVGTTRHSLTMLWESILLVSVSRSNQPSVA